MKIMKYLFVLFFIASVATTVTCQPVRTDYWQNFIVSGANKLPGYRPDTISVDLGSNIAGYELGRFGLHSLMWGHLTWVRSPEYSHPSTTVTQRRRYLQDANDWIDTMTNVRYFRDISGCGDISYKGPTHEAIRRFHDGFSNDGNMIGNGYKGWGQKRSMDAMVALPDSMPRILKDQWYRMKIRCENSPSNMFTTITIWLAPGSSPFPSTPHYMQTYRGLEKGSEKYDPILPVTDDGWLNKDPVSGLLQPQQVWYRKGTVAILSCFSNISVKNLAVLQRYGRRQIAVLQLAGTWRGVHSRY